MLKLIINADDLGRNRDVDDAIVTCIEKGLINSSTIMANGEDFVSVKSITERHPEISYGVHLVIDEMECLTKPKIFVETGITDVHGFFIKGGIRKTKINRKIKEAVFQEWCAQIDRIQGVGINIDHIDSHHHLHTLPELFETLLKLSRKYKINKIRNTTYIPRYLHISPVAVANHHISTSIKNVKHPSIISRIYNVVRSYNTHRKFCHYFDTTDLFCSVNTYFAYKEIIDSYKRFKSIELMCHPGHPNYEDETQLLALL